MEKYLPYAVLLLRFALTFTLLVIITDKLGYWGSPGEPTILWGEWDLYVASLQRLIAFIPAGLVEKLAVGVTVLEAALALMLLFGLKVRWAAIGTGIYTLIAAILLLLTWGVKHPANYSLFIVCAACFLLACCPIYRFTTNGIKKRSTYHPY